MNRRDCRLGWIVLAAMCVALPMAHSEALGQDGDGEAKPERTFAGDLERVLDEGLFAFEGIRGKQNSDDEKMVRWAATFSVLGSEKFGTPVIIQHKGEKPVQKYSCVLAGSRSAAEIAREKVNYKGWIGQVLESHPGTWTAIKPQERQVGEIKLTNHVWLQAHERWPGNTKPPQVYLTHAELANGNHQLELMVLVPMLKSDDGAIISHADQVKMQLAHLIEQSEKGFKGVRGEKVSEKNGRTTYATKFAVLGSTRFGRPLITQAAVKGHPSWSHSTHLALVTKDGSLDEYVHRYEKWIAAAMADHPKFERKPDRKSRRPTGEMTSRRWVRPPGDSLQTVELTELPLKSGRRLLSMSVSHVRISK